MPTPATYFTSSAATNTGAQTTPLDWNAPTTPTTERTSAAVGYQGVDTNVTDYASSIPASTNQILGSNQYAGNTGGTTQVQNYNYGDSIPTTATVRDNTYDAGDQVTRAPVAAPGAPSEFNQARTSGGLVELPKDSQGNTAYDLQRQRVQADAEMERQRRTEAMNRYLGGQGLDDSGIALQQMNQMTQQLGQETQASLSDITQQELGYQQEQMAAEQEHAFAREERVGTQQYEQQQFERDMGLKESFFDLESQGQYQQYQQQLRAFEETQYQYDIATGLEKQRLGQDLVMQERALNATADTLRANLASTEKLAYMQSAESARQFDAGLMMDAELASAELAFRQEELGKTLSLEDSKMYNQMQVDLAKFEETKYQFDAAQGLEKEQLYQDMMIARNQLQESTNQLAMKIDADTKLEHQKAVDQYFLNIQGVEGQRAMALLNTRLEVGLKNLDGTIAEQAEINKIHRERYYNMGVSGQELSTDELSLLQKTDPAAYDAYMGGKAGEALANVEARAFQSQQFLDAAIMNLAEYKGDEFTKRLNALYQELGLELPGGTAAAPAGARTIGVTPVITANPPPLVGMSPTTGYTTDNATRSTLSDRLSGATVPEGMMLVPDKSAYAPDGGYMLEQVETGGTQIDETSGIPITVDLYQGQTDGYYAGNALNDSISRRPQGVPVEQVVGAHYRINGWPDTLTDPIDAPNQPHDKDISSDEFASMVAARDIVTSNPSSIRFVTLDELEGLTNAERTALQGSVVLLSDDMGNRGFSPMYIVRGGEGEIFTVNLENGVGYTR